MGLLYHISFAQVIVLWGRRLRHPRRRGGSGDGLSGLPGVRRDLETGVRSRGQEHGFQGRGVLAHVPRPSARIGRAEERGGRSPGARSLRRIPEENLAVTELLIRPGTFLRTL